MNIKAPSGIKMVLVIALSIILSASCEKTAKTDNNTTDTTADLTIKSNVITQSFTGNGFQWGGYDMLNAWTGSPTLSDADWNVLYQRIRFMRPPVVRIMVTDGWNYMSNGVFDPIKSAPVLLKILDFCQAEGITVIFGEWGHQGGTTIDQVWLENASKFLEWLLNTKQYTCIKYFNMVNEPNGDW